MRYFLRFPDFKWKALTLSYDDGVQADKRLIAILNKHGIKATFNVNTGLAGQGDRIPMSEWKELYAGHELAVHGQKHLSLIDVPTAIALNDVLEDRKSLEKLLEKPVTGMAYAYGTFNDEVVQMLKECGIDYSRTVISTGRFDVPKDWLRLPATCHHNDTRLNELAKTFAELSANGPYWRNHPKLFYLWGHSYEFNNNDNWQVIEDFAAYMGGRDDIWYATNGEIFNYVQAFERLIFSVDGTLVFNPTNVDVYLNVKDKNVIVHAGETLALTK